MNGKTTRFSLPLLVLMIASLACSLPGLSLGGTVPTPVPTINMNPAPGTPLPQTTQTLPVKTTGPVNSPSQTPQGGQPSTGKTPTNGTPPPTGKIPADLPPALVEVDPPANSDLSTHKPLTLFFNQAMQRASVEKALQIQPPVKGKLSWLDDATLRFLPEALPPPNTAVTLTVSTAAKAANGETLPEAWTVTYQAPPPLLLTNRLPEPGVPDGNPSSAVIASFNQPVTPLGADANSLPAAFTLDPPVNGRGEWINTSTYAFYPGGSLPGGVEFTVKLNPALQSTAGVALSSDTSPNWTFTTALPKLLSLDPSPEKLLTLDPSLKLAFNQPMERASVESNLSLVNSKGIPVKGTLSWNAAGTESTFKPEGLLDRGSTYTLILLAAASNLGGTPLGSDTAIRLSTVPALRVAQSAPAERGVIDVMNGYASFSLTFNAPLKPEQDWQSLLMIYPAIGDPTYFLNEDSTQLFVSGFFNPSTSYTLDITDLNDRWDGALATPFHLDFSTSAAAPALVIPVMQYGAPALFVAQGENEIPASNTNVTRAEIASGALSLADFLHAAQNPQGLQDWQAHVQAKWVKLYFIKPNVPETDVIPLTPSGDPPNPGLYFLKVDPTLLPGQGNPQDVALQPVLIVVSPIQMTLKLSASQAFVWAVNLGGSTPQAQALVTFFDGDMNVLGTCSTDEKGACQADLAARKDSFQPVFAVMGNPGDPNFSLVGSNWSMGVAAWEFGLPYTDQSQAPKVYVYTDRPIYRPGQTVNLRVVARNQDNGRYSLPAQQDVSLNIEAFDPLTSQGKVLQSLKLPLSPFGTTSGAYTLPEDLASGAYYIDPPGEPFTGISFEVSAYRKPEFALKVDFSRPEALYGEDLAVGISAAYYFGAPAGNLPLHWVLYSRQDLVTFPGGLSAGPLNLSWLEPDQVDLSPNSPGAFVMEGSAQTGPDGSLAVSISGSDLKQLLKPGVTYHLTLEVTAQDETGLPVSGRGSTRLNPSQMYIGLRPESWMGVAGKDFVFSIRTLDWKGDPVPTQSLTAHFKKVTWVQSTNAYGVAAFKPQYSDAGSTDFKTSDQGEARLSFLPGEPGTYQIELSENGKGSGQSGALTQQIVWVGGTGGASWPNPVGEHLLLQKDADAYQPGQNANILIPNPFGSPALALVTIERGKVMRALTVAIPDSSYSLALPLTEEDAPNIYVSVTLLGRENNRPAFRSGYIGLDVQPVAEVLKVQVEANPKQTGPGDQVNLAIKVKDSAGKPVQAEFSMALVDKAVLALADPNAPGIVQAFYATQPLGVATSLSLVNYAGRYSEVPPQGGRGGGGGAEKPPVRDQFADTAFWSGSITTDANGAATLSVKLPDNLTTWVVDTRGVTVDTRVGEATTELSTSKPLLIRPVTPLFAVSGDHLELAAVVQNNTKDPLKTQVSLQATGFLLDDPNRAEQSVDLEPGGRKRVAWQGVVQDVDSLDLVFKADSGSLSDAVAPETGKLPVLRYSSPQSYSTSGVLESAGEKVEVVSLPRSFTPTGGSLSIELSPSLASAFFNLYPQMDGYSTDFTEPVVSRLLASVAANQGLADAKSPNSGQKTTIQTSISSIYGQLTRLQNQDGGWGWSAGNPSDPYITAYALFGLAFSSQMGHAIDATVISNAQTFLLSNLTLPTKDSQTWELDRLAFETFSLVQSGQKGQQIGALYNARDRLSPSGKAFLLLADNPPSDAARQQFLVSDLETTAVRSASGVYWENTESTGQNWATTGVASAVVVFALQTVAGQDPLLPDAVRYLALNRVSSGAVRSSYETAWVLLALEKVMHTSGEDQPGYDFSASLNGAQVVSQKAQPASLDTITSSIPLASLSPNSPNALQIARGAGSGRLYYRAVLQVDRPVEGSPAFDQGLSIQRQYFISGADCTRQACPPVDSVELSKQTPVVVRLTLVVPHDMNTVVIEDAFPAGAEVLDTVLKTSQQGSANPEGQEGSPVEGPVFDPTNPFQAGWGWWLFTSPQISDTHIRWVAQSLPAGTYQLTYRLVPYLSGEFRVLPARAWEYYFPEVQAASQGELFTIK